MDQEPRRQNSARQDLRELAERVARLETTAEHRQAVLTRIDAHLAKLEAKLDLTATTMAQGVGGLRVGAVLAQATAAVAGFVAAHLWPGSK